MDLRLIFKYNDLELKTKKFNKKFYDKFNVKIYIYEN